MQLGEAFAAKLMSAHAETCIWRTTSTSDRLATFPPITPDAVLAAFERRASHIAALGHLPSVELQPASLPPTFWPRCR